MEACMRVLGVNAVFHDPAAALVVDGATVAAAEEERFSRRKHGKRPFAFSTSQLPEQAMRCCLAPAGLEPADVDAVVYSCDPALAGVADDPWEWLRTLYAERFPHFCATALPGLDPAVVRYVPHHVAHAASAGLAAPFGGDTAVLVLDGRGERASHLAGRYRRGVLETLAVTDLPSSLGLLYEETGAAQLTMAGGVALNCVANTLIAEQSGFAEVWVQPAAGDAGTALGAALHVARAGGDTPLPFLGADLGRGYTDEELEQVLRTARVRYERPPDVAQAVAEELAHDGLVAWFAGRAEWGPRALGHRSLLANPARRENLARLNDVKGREQFRPVAPMVRLDRAVEVFRRGPVPSPYMLFVHDVRPQWMERIPAVVHVDGTARIQTVDDARQPELARILQAFGRLTRLPVVVNTSLNTAGRPMVDTPRDALELFGSAPVDVLAIGPFVLRREWGA